MKNSLNIIQKNISELATRRDLITRKIPGVFTASILATMVPNVAEAALKKKKVSSALPMPVWIREIKSEPLRKMYNALINGESEGVEFSDFRYILLFDPSIEYGDVKTIDKNTIYTDPAYHLFMLLYCRNENISKMKHFGYSIKAVKKCLNGLIYNVDGKFPTATGFYYKIEDNIYKNFINDLKKNSKGIFRFRNLLKKTIVIKHTKKYNINSRDRISNSLRNDWIELLFYLVYEDNWRQKYDVFQKNWKGGFEVQIRELLNAIKYNEKNKKTFVWSCYIAYEYVQHSYFKKTKFSSDEKNFNKSFFFLFRDFVLPECDKFGLNLFGWEKSNYFWVATFYQTEAVPHFLRDRLKHIYK
ncbi:MAG: hypothetical protein OCD00_03730 [Colwellia sp.]